MKNRIEITCCDSIQDAERNKFLFKDSFNCNECKNVDKCIVIPFRFRNCEPMNRILREVLRSTPIVTDDRNPGVRIYQPNNLVTLRKYINALKQEFAKTKSK